MENEPVTPFERKITKVVPCMDGTAEVTYECGHGAIWIIPPQVTASLCADCVHDYVAAQNYRGREESDVEA